MALAEKWRLTLFQPTNQSMSKSVRRNSYLAGVDTTGLITDAELYQISDDDEGGDAQACAAGTEESKSSEQFEDMPNVVIIKDDYFQTDAEEKVMAQI